VVSLSRLIFLPDKLSTRYVWWYFYLQEYDYWLPLCNPMHPAYWGIGKPANYVYYIPVRSQILQGYLIYDRWKERPLIHSGSCRTIPWTSYDTTRGFGTRVHAIQSQRFPKRKTVIHWKIQCRKLWIQSYAANCATYSSGKRIGVWRFEDYNFINLRYSVYW